MTRLVQGASARRVVESLSDLPIKASALRLRSPQAVQNHDDFGDLVYQHDGGQAQHAADRQRHQHDDDGQRQHDVLVDDPAASAGVL